MANENETKIRDAVGPTGTESPAKSPVDVPDMSRDAVDAWLEANCGNGIPHGEATDTASMLHGLAYVLRQIESTDRYMVNIGQVTSATSALRMALDRFALVEMERERANGPSEAKRSAAKANLVEPNHSAA